MIDVVSLPDAPFLAPLRTNRQHMASALARGGHARVLYIDPPRLRRGPALVRSLERRKRGTPVEVEAGLWVLQTRLPVPYRWALRAAPRLITAYLAKRAAKAATQLGFRRPVLWSYSPLGAFLMARVPHSAVVYDLVDDYLAQPNYTRLRLEGAHRTLLSHADLIFCTTEKLRRTALAHSERPVLVTGNACDVQLFSRAQGPGNPRMQRRPYVLFWGAITEDKVDLTLVQNLARELRAELDLVFIGPITAGARRALSDLTNVVLCEHRTQEELLPVVAGAVAGIIPYSRSAYTESVSALKLYEAFAAGTQVVASPLPMTIGLEDHLWVAESVDAWIDAITRIRSGETRPPPPDVASHSWDHKAARSAEAIRSVLSDAEGSHDPSGLKEQ